MESVLPLPFKIGKRHAERVWANCLRNLFSGGFIGLRGFLGRALPPLQNPEGRKKSKNIEISSEIEIFEREWNFRASHPPRPLFLWGIRDVKTENFKRDSNFRSRLKISSEIDLFWLFRPSGKFILCLTIHICSLAGRLFRKVRLGSGQKAPSKRAHSKFAWRRVNREVQTAKWVAGQ